MVFRVQRTQVQEFRPHEFMSDASELGLAPGEWPARIETDLGNGQALIRERLNEAGATYRQELGCVRLSIFND